MHGGFWKITEIQICRHCRAEDQERKQGENAGSVTWLAMAQPSSLLKWSQAAFSPWAVRRNVLYGGCMTPILMICDCDCNRCDGAARLLVGATK